MHHYLIELLIQNLNVWFDQIDWYQVANTGLTTLAIKILKLIAAAKLTGKDRNKSVPPTETQGEETSDKKQRCVEDTVNPQSKKN